MILDTSAMVAILYREPEAADFTRLVHGAETCRISVANYCWYLPLRRHAWRRESGPSSCICNVWAVGEMTGEPMLAHRAERMVPRNLVAAESIEG